ncbi:hypothetical protein D9M70_495030 [compost metagenome]
MADLGHMEAAAPLHMHAARRLLLLEGGDRRLEVARIGKAVGADRAAIRQCELGAIVLADIAAPDLLFTKPRHLEHGAARHDADFRGLHIHLAEFREDLDRARFRNDQEFAVGIEEIVVHHVGVEGIGMGRHSGLRRRIARRRHGADALKEVQFFRGRRQRVPAQLAERQGMLGHMRRRLPVRIVDLGKPPGVADARADAVEPGALVGAARRGKGRAGELLGIEPVGAFLWTVLALR